MAAPVASKILAEALPYLEISKDDVSNEDIRVNVEVPSVVGLSYKDAKKVLEDAGLQIIMRNQADEKSVSDDFVVSNQVPSVGVQILKGGSVIVE